MKLPGRQRGMGMWGYIFWGTALGGLTIVGLQLTPIYINEMALQRVVGAAAEDPGAGSMDAAALRRALQTRWDVEGITKPDIKDVKVIKTRTGRALTYEYQSSAPLFANLEVVASFKKEFPIRDGGPSD